MCGVYFHFLVSQFPRPISDESFCTIVLFLQEYTIYLFARFVYIENIQSITLQKS